MTTSGNRRNGSNGQTDPILTRKDGNRIEEVVVFSDQAFVKRRVAAGADEGLCRFLMEIEALRVDSDSVQATVFGHGEIISAQYQEIPVPRRPQGSVRTLEERRGELARQKSMLHKEREIVAKQIRFLDSMVDSAESDMPKRMRIRPPTVDELKSTLGFLDDGYHGLIARENDLDRQLEEIDREASANDSRLKQIRGPKQASVKVIEVLFQSSGEQEVRIEASYIAFGARWTPAYKVDVAEDLTGARLTMQARIEQKTGEHWQDVRMSVSNAVPMRGTSLPEATPWYLSMPRPVQVAAMAAGGGEMMKRSRASLAGSTAASEDLEVLLEEPPEAEYAEAEVTELPLAFEYGLPQDVEIRSGDGETLLPLFTRRLESRFFHYAMPLRDPTAYLVCAGKPDRALLAGRLNLHFGGRFVGSTRFDERKAGQEMLLNLGADRGVRVSREKRNDKVTETFFNMMDRSNPAREFRYWITVENLKEQPVRVRLLEALPISRSDKIQVKIEEVEPAPTEKDFQGQQGVMMWDLEVESGKTREIDVQFEVKHPRDLQPVGLTW